MGQHILPQVHVLRHGCIENKVEISINSFLINIYTLSKHGVNLKWYTHFGNHVTSYDITVTKQY